MKQTSIRTMLVVVLVLAGFSTVHSLQGGQNGGKPRPALLEPIKRPLGNLHDLATQSGGKFVAIFKPNRGRASGDLVALAKQSEAVVIGRVLAQRAHLTPDGTFITTSLQVVIQEVLKGNLTTRRTISVRLPGGAHRFPDGTSAQLHCMNYRETRNDGTYVFFLRTSTDGQYDVTGEIEGQFELDFQSRQVWPSERGEKAPLEKKYSGRIIADFLSILHGAVGRKK